MNSIRKRLSIVIGVFAILSIGMLIRAVYFQVWGDAKLTQLAKRQFQSKVLMKPRRGLILDRAGEPLAINLETSSLAGSPQKILKSEPTLRLLAKALNTTVLALRKKLDPKKSFAWFERHVSDERMVRFKRMGIVQPNGDMPEGLWIEKEMKRVYPHGDLAAPLVGSVNVDTDGIEGVELWKNSFLCGKSASFDAFRDALGRPALYSSNAQTKMQDGETIELSIDTSLQYSIEESVRAALEKTNSQSALAVVMDSENGEILALAQALSPALSSAHTRRIKKVMALTDGYEPGSTLKSIFLASAINKGVVKLSDSLFGHYGKLKLQNRTISEAEAHEKFGYLTLKKMLEVSSNIVAAELALKLGAERTVTSLKEFGFGNKTGTNFPGEISGRIPAQSKGIRPLTLATIGFGQSLVVTPMQMLRAYAAFSNGGYLVEPTLLKIKENETAKKTALLKKETVKDITQALIGVTEGEKGTGKKAQVAGYRVAGKTGTAQAVDPRTRHYSTSRHIASFIGYPVGVKRPVTILTLLDNPKGIYYASETAAPLFAEVLQAVVNRFSIPATEKVEMRVTEETPSPDQTLELVQSSTEIAEDSAKRIKEVNIDHPVMPSLKGLTPQEAMQSLLPFAPIIQMKGFGLIQNQVPEAGALLSQNVRVTLFLGE